MPTHVTLLHPFADAAAIDAEVKTRLAQVAAATAPFELSFLEIGRFAETVWLKPEPAAPVVRLIEALATAFPAYPPYGGAYAQIAPHLTVAQGPRHVLDRVKAELRARLDAPIRTRATAIELYGLQADRWRLLETFRLSSPV
jgi:2'-5' RNA ligase